MSDRTWSRVATEWVRPILRTAWLLAAGAALICWSSFISCELNAQDEANGRGALTTQRPPRKQRQAPSSINGLEYRQATSNKSLLSGRSTRTGAISRAQSPPSESSDSDNTLEAIQATAQLGWTWPSSDGWGQHHLLRGRSVISQGNVTLSSDQATLWISTPRGDSPQRRVRIYLEGNVHIGPGNAQRTVESYTAEWTTAEEVQFTIPRSQVASMEQDPFFRRALTIWTTPGHSDPDVNNIRTSGTSSQPGSVVFANQSLDEQDHPDRRLRFFSRSETPFNAYSFTTKNTTPPEQVLVITGGVNLVIDGVEETGTVDLRADHMVVWTQAVTGFDDQATETLVQRRDAPLQIYLEGNIVVLQEDPKTKRRTSTKAQRAFFDIREHRAVLQEVEVKVNSPQLPLSVRIRAEEVRQQSKSSFHALNAWVTTSQFGKPGYRIEASDVLFEQRPNPRSSDSKQSEVLQASHQGDDSGPGVPEPESTPWVTTLNPTLRVEDVPVFWWPRLSGPIQSMNTPLRRLTAENDSVFGAQVRSGWDLYKLFGNEAPAGVDATLLADYLSLRGPAGGIAAQHEVQDRFGLGDASGRIDGYGIYDEGVDNLGLDRRELSPPDKWRGRFLFRDRQEIGDNFTLISEAAFISDRNFMEQYFEQEYDTGKDQETLLYLKHQRGDTAWTGMTRARVNEFDTTSEWLPKADLYILGRPLFDGMFNWSSHSSLGYGHLRPAEAPTDPSDIYSALPYVADREGLVAMSRHEVTAPFMLGPVNLVPYAMGEAAYWGQDLGGNDMLRMYGSAGIRGSLMFTKAMPEVQSSIFGLRGLVHKMVFDFDYSISDSSQPLGEVAQYNEFDDQSQYRFRNRLLMNTFGGTLPAQFDPRTYAVRSGAAHNVTAPYYELVDTQQVLRLGWRHRWQTQAGPIENPRMRDWMTLDLEASFFPNADRDNFGQPFGLLGGRYAWNVSERTSLLASGYFDTFDNAQQIWNVGWLSQRSERGSAYVGVRQVKGAGLDSQILTASYSYQMSPKWISTLGTAYDLAEGRNRGQSVTVTRVGRDFLWHLGANYDASKDNYGIMLSVEPRFLSMLGFRDTSSSNPQLGSFLGGY